MTTTSTAWVGRKNSFGHPTISRRPSSPRGPVGRQGDRRRIEVMIGGVLASLSTPCGPVVLREATRDDVPSLVGLYADDELGTGGDGGSDLTPYLRAFDAIDADRAHLLVVAERAGDVVGTLQLSLLPVLVSRGALRAQLEGVHVRSNQRGTGVGSAMVRWAVDEARRRGCAQVQLTSQKRRTDAHRFYLRLGFANSHEGFKLVFPGGAAAADPPA